MEEEFVNTLQTKAKHLFSKLKTIKVTEISINGIKFGDGSEMDYASAFKKVIKDLDTDKRLIIMIDEFAQAIENIIKYEDIKKAQSLLKTHRELRQDSAILNKITFIYAGSIGLESVAAKIDSIGRINDLSTIKILPLKFDNAKEFVTTLSKTNDIKIEEQEIEYLLTKIEWLIPFYIQLIIEQLRQSKELITVQMIDDSFNSILDNRNHFEHWHSRLKSMADDEYQFSKEILNIISKKMTMQSTEIINIASKYSLNETKAKEIIHSLIYDGYINNNDDAKVYRFNSPILRMWWYKNVAN